jgi:hypothetical protein
MPEMPITLAIGLSAICNGQISGLAIGIPVGNWPLILARFEKSLLHFQHYNNRSQIPCGSGWSSGSIGQPDEGGSFIATAKITGRTLC